MYLCSFNQRPARKFYPAYFAESGGLYLEISHDKQTDSMCECDFLGTPLRTFLCEQILENT